MKNQISHDSINRVEPSAKFLSEQKNKTEANEQANTEANKTEFEEKEVSPSELNNSNILENDQKGRSEREPSKNKHSKNPDDPPSTPNHYLGGQIFDSEA